MSDDLRAIHRMGRNLVVQAGAGTGKTWNLVKLYVHLLAGLTHNARPRDLGLMMGDRGLAVDGSGGSRRHREALYGFRPDQIVALTFTDKAAAEMRERIQARLFELEAAPLGDPELTASAAALGRPLPEPERWRELRLALSHAFIGTFHSYCGRILRENAVAAGIDPQFRQLVSPDDAELFEEVAKDVILTESSADGVAWRALYRYQLSQDRQFGGGLLEHLAALYSRLQVVGLTPDRLLEGSAYEPAAVDAAFGQAVRATLSAFHELSASAQEATAKAREKIQRVEAWLATHQGALLAVAPGEAGALVASLGEVYSALGGVMGKACDEARLAARASIDALREAAATADATPIARDLQDLLTRVALAFEARKRELGALDFQDLLVGARDLLRDDRAVRRQLKRDVSVLLVDEFQDTDQLQKDLIYLLAERQGEEAIVPPGADVATALSLERAKLFVVGDRKQSIYAFRGADVAIFERTLQELCAGQLAEEPPAEAERLSVCRRSLPALIEGANALFAAVMAEEGGGGGFDPRLDRLSPHRPDHGVAAAMELLDFPSRPSPPKKGRAADPPADPAALALPDTTAMDADERSRVQARAVAARIAEIVAGGLPLVHDKETELPRPPRYGDVVILLRRYSKLTLFTTQLILRRIPHLVVKGRGFYGAQEIRDLVNLLRIVSDPGADVALLGVLRSPLVCLSDDALTALALSRPDRPGLRLEDLRRRFLHPPAATVGAHLPPGLSAEDAARLTAFLTLHRRLRRQADRLGAAGILEAALEATAFDATLAGTFQGDQKLANVEKLLRLAREHQEEGGGVPAFVRRMARLLEEEPREGQGSLEGEGADVVRIMTVHASKGLEFPIVIIPECEAALSVKTPPMIYDRALGFGLKLADPDPRRESQPTGAWGAIHEGLKERARAEHQRLLYVAVTRAREHVILSGLPRSTPAPANTWWRWVGDARGALEDAGLVTASDGWALAARPLPDLSAATGPRSREDLLALGAGLTDAAREEGAARRAAALPPDPRAIRVRTLVAPVTQLDDFQLCPRRYLLWHELNLEEHPNLRGNRPAEPAAGAGDLPEEETAAQLDPLRRGTLAHALLEEVDLSRFAAVGGLVIDALLEDQGYALTDPQVASVRDDVVALLSSGFGAGLMEAAPSRVHREWPFTLRVQGEGPLTLFVSGKMDLLIEAEASAPLRVIDYKHTRREGRTAADYRFQLMAYALAARSLLGATDIRAEIVFLRDRGHAWTGGPMALTPTGEELDAFEAELAALGSRLARARLADDFSLSEPAHCQAIRCGYLWRCHPDAARRRR